MGNIHASRIMADAIMLIDAIKGKYDFPELKMVALDQYKYWQPETVIIEAKGKWTKFITRI